MKRAAKPKPEPVQTFQVSYPLYTVASLIFISGASLGIILDVESGRLPTILNTTIGFLFLVGIFALGAFGKMRRSDALGASFLVTAVVWILESFFTPSSDLNRLINFLSNLVVLSSLLAAAGLMLNKIVSLFLGALLLVYLFFLGRPLTAPFPELEYYLYFFIFIISGLCFVIFYSRSQLERAVERSLQASRQEEERANLQVPAAVRYFETDRVPGQVEAADPSAVLGIEIAVERSDIVVGEIASGLLHLCSTRHSGLPEIGGPESLLANYYLPLRRGTKAEPALLDLRQILDDAVEVAVASQKSHSNLFQVRVMTRYAEDLQPIRLLQHELFFALFAILQTGFESVRERRIQSPNEFMPRVELEITRDDSAVLLQIRGNCFGNIVEFNERPPQNALSGKQGEFGTRQVLRRTHQILTVQHRGTFKVTPGSGEDTGIRITLPSTDG